MRIEKAKSQETPLAEQVSALIGVPSENIMVSKGLDGIEVQIGRLTPEGWKQTDDVPISKQSAIKAWAEKL